MQGRARGHSRAPRSSQRSAEFKERASSLLSDHRFGLPNVGAEIARALEQAYQRGYAEALEGPPEEPDTSSSLPWIQIPPRARSLFSSVCHGAFGTAAPAPEKAWDVMLVEALRPFPGEKNRRWHLYRKRPGRDLFEASRDDGYAAQTALKLRDLGLMEEAEHPDGRRVLTMSQYGFNTAAIHFAEATQY